MEDRFALRYVGVGLSGGMVVGALIGALLGAWLAVGGMMSSESPGADLLFLPLFGIVLGGITGVLPGLVSGLSCAVLLPRVTQESRRRPWAWLLGGAGTLIGLVGLVALLSAVGTALLLSWAGVVIFGTIAAVPMGWLMARTT